jgi:hypothetical protein
LEEWRSPLAPSTRLVKLLQARHKSSTQTIESPFHTAMMLVVTGDVVAAAQPLESRYVLFCCLLFRRGFVPRKWSENTYLSDGLLSLLGLVDPAIGRSLWRQDIDRKRSSMLPVPRMRDRATCIGGKSGGMERASPPSRNFGWFLTEPIVARRLRRGSLGGLHGSNQSAGSSSAAVRPFLFRRSARCVSTLSRAASRSPPG